MYHSRQLRLWSVGVVFVFVFVFVITASLLGACSFDEEEVQETLVDKVTARVLETNSPSEFQNFLQSPTNFTLLDVRTPEEFQEERISGAENIDFYASNFPSSLDQLDKDGSYLIYCRSGSRSGQALAMMQQLGFTNVRDLGGGINAWKEAGFEVEDSK